MDLINRFTELLKAIPADEFHEAIVCFETLKVYSVLVVDERLSMIREFHYEEGICLADMRFWEKYRGDAHDAAINACSRLNELCEEVNVEKICDFDVTDRKKVAEFCGFVLSALFYSNINCKDPVTSWLSFADKPRCDTETFLDVFKEGLTEKINRRFDDIGFVCRNAYIKENKLCLDYEFPKGYSNTKCSEINPDKITLPGYIDKVVDKFYLYIVSDYLTKDNENAFRELADTESKEKLEKLLDVFDNEFSRWRNLRLREYGGDHGRIIQDICQIMSKDFFTQPCVMDDLLSPLAPEEIEEILNRWSKALKFSFEETTEKNLAQTVQKSWLITKDGVGCNLRVDLKAEGYIVLTWEKLFSESTVTFQVAYAYNISSVKSEIWRWISRGGLVRK